MRVNCKCGHSKERHDKPRHVYVDRQAQNRGLPFKKGCRGANCLCFVFRKKKREA